MATPHVAPPAARVVMTFVAVFMTYTFEPAATTNFVPSGDDTMSYGYDPPIDTLVPAEAPLRSIVPYVVASKALIPGGPAYTEGAQAARATNGDCVNTPKLEKRNTRHTAVKTAGLLVDRRSARTFIFRQEYRSL